MTPRTPGVTLLAAALIAAPFGCADDGSTATVVGSVTYDGKPVKDASLTIIPEGGEGSTFGARIKDGQYKAPGVSLGKKKFQVIPIGQVEAATTTAPQKPAAKSENDIPKNASGNNLVVDVKAGSMTVDLKLERPKPGG